jgi:hypothetical protein
MSSRTASHSGSWYTDNGRALARQLDGWLGLVPDAMDNVGSLPTAGARVIIAPYETLITQDELPNNTDRKGMRAIHTRGPVLPTHTRPWTSPKRELISPPFHQPLMLMKPASGSSS